ncbi:DNA/RNA polymerases superfamily protein [Gossypium australe]|uniref:DNA/RNA polymerases superfamily protein n=1 Tax=Gossypium australe TaxID=47621 RepID=A0A5B6VW60_9ROSI|nr:DNA/RNA polymerases superfamily protein [Gossypium australe]
MNVLVRNPLGQSTVVNKLIRDCPLAISEHVFLADLLVLSFYEFDAILGLDWLTRHNVMGKEIILSSRQSKLANIIIFTKITEKMIFQGVDAYLAYIMDTLESRSEINRVIVVREFLDVFPNELPRVPLSEIEFSVELEPGTTPISNIPYRMASIELKKLKE